MISIRKVLSVLLVIAALTACSEGSDNGSPRGNDPLVGELGYDPNQRWPETGSYSYNFSESINGNGCEAKKSFGSKAEYCMGLQDHALHSDCALAARKATYGRACGDDFQQMNIKNDTERSGYDPRLQRHCSIARTENATFKTTKRFCEFLKAEDLHKGCFWDYRLARFQNLECAGSFTAAPAPMPQPTPTPSPTPRPQPSPTPEPNDPEDSIAIVQELRAEGVTVDVNWDAIYRSRQFPLPEDLPIQQQMAIFWSELAANKAEILRRKTYIKDVHVTSYAAYNSDLDARSLSFDFDNKAGQLAQYFPLFDQMLAVRRDLGIAIDTIHSGYRRDGVTFTPLRQILTAVASQQSTLSSMRGMIREIDLESYSNYYSPNGSLTLRRDHVSEDLATYVQLLRPISPFFAWAAKNSVEIESEFDIEKDAQKVQGTFKFLEARLAHFDAMVQAGMLKAIIIRHSETDAYYWDHTKEMTIGIGPSNQTFVSNVITALGKVAKLSRELNRPIEIENSTVSESSLKAVALLDRVLGSVKAKLNKIKKIAIGYETRYWAHEQELTIGYSSTVQQTEKVVSEIR